MGSATEIHYVCLDKFPAKLSYLFARRHYTLAEWIFAISAATLLALIILIREGIFLLKIGREVRVVWTTLLWRCLKSRIYIRFFRLANFLNKWKCFRLVEPISSFPYLLAGTLDGYLSGGFKWINLLIRCFEWLRETPQIFGQLLLFLKIHNDVIVSIDSSSHSINLKVVLIFRITMT